MPKKHYDKTYFSIRDQLDPHISHSLKLFCIKHDLHKILDVGCGTGLLVNFFNEHGFKAIGLDKYFKHKSIVSGSADKLVFPANSFDLITGISVIEHLTPNQSAKFLSQTFRILKPGGYIFLITPNLASPFRQFKDNQWFAYTDPTHIQFFTPETLINELTIHNFKYPQLRFPIDSSVKFKLHLPVFLHWLPGWANYFLTYLLISSPFSTCRDSFWLAAQKPKV